MKAFAGREMDHSHNPSVNEQSRLAYGHLIQQIRNAGNKLDELANAASSFIPVHRNPAALEATIRRVLTIRRMRTRIFNQKIFGEPAWDILLELYAARLGSKREYISSLCIASGAPPTTALRWINSLEECRLIRRHSDPNDGRRSFMELTKNGLGAMERFFEQADVIAGI